MPSVSLNLVNLLTNAFLYQNIVSLLKERIVIDHGLGKIKKPVFIRSTHASCNQRINL